MSGSLSLPLGTFNAIFVFFLLVFSKDTLLHMNPATKCRLQTPLQATQTISSNAIPVLLSRSCTDLNQQGNCMWKVLLGMKSIFASLTLTRQNPQRMAKSRLHWSKKSPKTQKIIKIEQICMEPPKIGETPKNQPP